MADYYDKLNDRLHKRHREDRPGDGEVREPRRSGRNAVDRLFLDESGSVGPFDSHAVKDLHVVTVFNTFECLGGGHTAVVQDTVHVLGQRGAHFGVRRCVNGTAFSEAGFFGIDSLDEHGDKTAYPSLAVDYIGNPAKLLNGFQYTQCIEACTFGVGVVFLSVFIAGHLVIGKEFVIVDEVNLDACTGNARYLYDKRMVCIVHNQVHSAQADNFVELVAPFIDDTPFGHKGSYFATAFLGQLG